MKRCVSKCSGIKEEACKEPCSFVNKKFCRLSTQYKMGPYPECEVTKKESAKTKTVPKTVQKSRAKTTKTVPKTLPKPVTKTLPKPVPKTVPEDSPTSMNSFMNHLLKKMKTSDEKTVSEDSPTSMKSITNLVLKKMKTPAEKEKVKNLQKLLNKYPSNTLFHTLDKPIQKKVHDFIKTIDGVSPDPPHNADTIYETKKMLNKIIPKRVSKTVPKTVSKNVSKTLPKTVPKSRTKTAKSIPKTVPKTAPKTVAEDSRTSMNGITNLVLKKMKTSGTKEKVEELHKLLDKYPSDTLFYTLDKSIQKKVYDLIKTIDGVSLDPPDNTETISEMKKMLNKIITKRDETSARTIQTFMKKTEGKRKALFYGTICSDSGVCIALGKERQKLLDFFKFETFEYAKEPYKTIGEVSGNGFVKELKYEREGYTAYALLKSSLRTFSDNLAYEYLVGKYLNEVSKKYPTFIETYGLFHYSSLVERNKMRQDDTLSKPLIRLEPSDIKNVCIKSGNLCIMSQYLKNTKTFYQHTTSEYFRQQLSAHVFYQIYFTLHQLRKEFTHYDLHLNNVMLYEPDERKYIQYHHHYVDRTVSYKSGYLVKIIDYGRCFFKKSFSYYDKICAEPRCGDLCGLHKGFTQFHEPHPHLGRVGERVFGHANALYKNESHDLRMMYFFYNHTQNTKDVSLDADYMKILKDTIYMISLSMHSRPGTIEDLGKSDKIHNVSDACQRWEEYITHPDRVQANETNFVNHTCLGELHIYTDGRDMEYIPK
jgi:hypothetical protein